MTGILGTGYQYGDTDFIALQRADLHGHRPSAAVRHRPRRDRQGARRRQARLPQGDPRHPRPPREGASRSHALRPADARRGPARAAAGSAIHRTRPSVPWPAIRRSRETPARARAPVRRSSPSNPTLSAEPRHAQEPRRVRRPHRRSTTRDPTASCPIPGEPAIPMDSVNVDQPGYVLRGVGFIDGTYTDETVVPLNGAPATELKTAHTPFNSPTFFPSTMWTPSYYGALSQGGGTRLLVTPAQHRAINPGRRRGHPAASTSHLGLKLFYSNKPVARRGLGGPLHQRGHGRRSRRKRHVQRPRRRRPAGRGAGSLDHLHRPRQSASGPRSTSTRIPSSLRSGRRPLRSPARRRRR